MGLWHAFACVADDHLVQPLETSEVDVGTLRERYSGDIPSSESIATRNYSQNLRAVKRPCPVSR